MNIFVTLGIIGTALGAIANGNGFGGIFGGNQAATTAAYVAGECADPHVSKDAFWKQNLDIQKEIGRIDYDALKHNYELYINLDNKINALAVKDAQLEATLPLAMQLAAVNAERYADNKLATFASEQTAFNFIMQREIDKKISGTMGLPWSDIITGVPSMPSCAFDVTCGSKS